MPSQRSTRFPSSIVRIALILAAAGIVSALACFRAFASGPEYIKAVNYFGRSWPLAFWNSDLSGVAADFRDIRADGFNSVILIVPWGEFQPGVAPIRFNEDAYSRLKSVCSNAHSAGLKVFMRVSYSLDYYPGVQQPNTDRDDSLLSGIALIPAWDQYLAKINAATQECANGAFISWEDFWDVIWNAAHRKTPEERAAYSKQIGYDTWIERQSDGAYKARNAADYRRFGVYPIPDRDNPDFEMVLQYFDDQLMNKLLAVLAKNFRQASVEARTDSDPIYNGKEVLKWYAHTIHYEVKSSNYLMTYWSPATAAANTGEKDSSTTVIARFNYLQRDYFARTPNQMFIDQWNFIDNGPQFPRNAQLNPAEVSLFIRNSARPLAQFTAGYALWNWRDYRASILFNGFFALGKLGWTFSPRAVVQELPEGASVRLPKGQFIRQDVPRARDNYGNFFERISLRLAARGDGRLRINIGPSSQDVNIHAATGFQAVTLDFPDPRGRDPNVVVTAMSGTIDVKDLYLWTFEQVSSVKSSDNIPGEHYGDIVALNRKLDDPNIVVSSVSASDDTIEYLAGAARPDSGGEQGLAWVGPYAKVKLNAAAPAIAINGYMNMDIYRAAKLFPEGCTLAASINGQTAARQLFTESQPIAMKVHVPPEAQGVVVLELSNNCSLIPEAVGLGPEERTLSYMIGNIQAESGAEP